MRSLTFGTESNAPKLLQNCFEIVSEIVRELIQKTVLQLHQKTVLKTTNNCLFRLPFW
jgi:hypothetical protein